jgi:hypothetical protein
MFIKLSLITLKANCEIFNASYLLRYASLYGNHDCSIVSARLLACWVSIYREKGGSRGRVGRVAYVEGKWTNRP